MDTKAQNHRRGAEAQRRYAKSKPESAEGAESAEGTAAAVGKSSLVRGPLPGGRGSERTVSGSVRMATKAQIHRRGAEAQRRYTKSKPESAEGAESAEGTADAIGKALLVRGPLPGGRGSERTVSGSVRMAN